MTKIISINGKIPTVDGKAIKAVGSVSNVEWHQCPTAVKAYLDYVSEHPYDADDYTYTHVTDFAPDPAVIGNTKPVGKTVDGITYYNEVPNIKTPFAGENKAGTLKPLDRLRWINTPANNVRDLGGWACDGGTVKYGKIIRGGAVTLADREVLVNQLGVRVDLNVYCQGEQLEWTESPLGADIKFVEARNYNWYSLSDKAAWKINIGAIFDAIAYNEPIYFHCGAGADRTGTLAVMVEALLGVSQSDIDTDYELTSFYQRRTRVPDATIPADLPSFINAIKSLGDGDLQQGAVNFTASLGFTAAEINAFRGAMIDGSPETVTPDVDTFTVTNNLTHAVSDNDAVSATEYQPYEANITPANGYTIESVEILMGGTDITNQVWNGKETTLNFAVANSLSHCTSNNQRERIIAGQMYFADINADSGYTLEGAAVSITMGGVEVSTQYYSNGKIAIPNVTGNIVINITAVQSAPSYTNLAEPDSVDWLDGYRFNSSGAPVALADCHIVNYIPCQNGDVIRIKGMSNQRPDGQVANTVCIYNASKEAVGMGNMETGPSVGNYSKVGDIITFTVLTAGTAYIRWGTAFLSGYTADDIVITVNEEIV